MTRRNPADAAASDVVQAIDDVSAAIADAGDLYGQWLEVQSAWWSSCVNWQAQWVRELQRLASELPPWMIWFNGPEQLA
ncbi:hypothetical protein [Caldimonas sp. KR1-144]|uniref:hypothetical protein n=1 Tax=Caldimonas sp. KR1-144 TaxID=3400911 RepID=UPI003C027C4E